MCILSARRGRCKGRANQLLAAAAQGSIGRKVPPFLTGWVPEDPGYRPACWTPHQRAAWPQKQRWQPSWDKVCRARALPHPRGNRPSSEQGSVRPASRKCASGCRRGTLLRAVGFCRSRRSLGYVAALLRRSRSFSRPTSAAASIECNRSAGPTQHGCCCGRGARVVGRTGCQPGVDGRRG